MKLLNKILLSLIALLTTLLLLGLLIWFNLDWIIQPRILHKTQNYFLPKAEITWESLLINIKSPDWISKDIQIKTQSSFCFNYLSNNGCIDQFELNIYFTLLKLPSIKIKKILLKAENISLDISRPHAKPTPVDFFQTYLKDFQSYIQILLNNKPESLAINLKEIQLHDNKNNFVLNFLIDKDNLNFSVQDDNLNIDIDSSFLLAQKNNFEWSGNINTLVAASEFKVPFKINISPSGTYNFDIKIVPKNTKARSKTLNFKSFVTNFSLNIRNEQSILLIKKFNFRPNNGFEAIVGNNCKIHFSMNDNGSTQFNCKNTQIKNIQHKELETINQNLVMVSQLFKTIHLKLSGYFNEKVYFNNLDNNIAQFKFDLNSQKKKVLNFISLGDFEFKKNNNYLNFIINKFEFNAELNSFKKLVQSLAKTDWAIPAPLNSLDGTVKLTVENVEYNTKETVLSANSKINLSGKDNQKLVVGANSKINISNNTKNAPHRFDLTMTLDKIHLYLPEIDPIRGLPSLTQDSRFKSEKATKKQSKSLAIDYQINFKTTNSDSIKIFYKYFIPYLSLELSAQINKNISNFSAKTNAPLKLSYLKRELLVKKFNLKKKKNSDNDIDLDGQIIYEASGYKISIDLIGDLEKPHITLSSNPPLPREDIISLIIYKRTTAELNPSENQNVGNTESAIKDRAIGLFGIWLFASTPIESVYYDSNSQTYSAQIALPGEVKLSVGTNWENSQMVGIKRRISENWSFVTTYQTGEENSVGNLFLQRIFSY